ncbi:MAG: MFS transporter [Erysipelotrichaceae bacterium]|nr:MFS transporter [Erysipelotrichaceae bacterium]
MINTKKISTDHALVHIGYQAFAGIIYGFSIYVLMQRGFNSAIAGYSLALANLLSLIIQPIVSNFLDRSKKISLFEMIVITSLLILVFYLISNFAKDGSVFFFIVFTLAVGCFSSIEPLFNTIYTIFNNNGIDIKFGKARAFGSASYGIICVLFGFLSESFSYISILIGGSIFALFLVTVSLIIRKDFYKADKHPVEIETSETVSFVEFVKNNKRYMLLCLFLTGIFYGYLATDNFTILVVENLGGNSKDNGLILGIKALLEAVAVFSIGKIRKHIGLEKLLVFASLCFILKSFTIYSATSLSTVYFAQIIQMFSFAMILPSMVEYADVKLPTNVAVRGQAFFTMTIGLGSVLSSLFAGSIINAYGVKTSNLVALIVTIISVIGFILTLLIGNYGKKK